MAPVGAKITPDGANMAQDGAKIAQDRATDRPKRADRPICKFCWRITSDNPALYGSNMIQTNMLLLLQNQHIKPI